MKVLINAVSAKLGGAATYVQNLARSLEEQAEPRDEFVMVVPPERAEALAPAGKRVRVEVSRAAAGSYARRWWWEQVTLRGIVSREKPDVLFSSANFAMLSCPCPQALLVRIPLYFSREYLKHVLPGKPAAFRAETALRRWLVCRSAASADCVVTPSAAMRDDLLQFTRIAEERIRVIPYGVPRARVVSGAQPEAPHAGGRLRLLWVSHYADHKNLATLLRAVMLLRGRGMAVELRLTVEPPSGGEQRGQHTVMPVDEQRLLAGLGDAVRYLGVLNYEQVWRAYRDADVFVFPSLCESFGHPLVEAMGAGLPIVASEIPVHREICGEAAQYFPANDAEVLAARLAALAGDAAARAEMARRGALRVNSFLWEDHVSRLLALLRDLATPRGARQALAARTA